MSTRVSQARTAAEVVEQFRELLATNAADGVQLSGRLRALIGEFSASASRGERVEPTELLWRWLDFNLAAYGVFSKQSVALLEGLLAAAEATLIPAEQRAAAARQDARVELRLAGRAGERVATSFVLENHFDRPVDVTFACDELASDAGGALPGSLVAFEPPTLAIPPRGEAVGTVIVSLSGEFTPGQTYTTRIRLLGFPERELGLSIRVLEAPDAVAPVVPGPAPARGGRSRARRQRPAP